MYLLCSVIFLCLTVLLYAVTLLGSRNPVTPPWAREAIVANVLTPLIIGFFTLGIAYFVQEVFTGFQPSFQESVYAALTVLGTVIVVMLMGIRKKLAAYSLATKSGEVIVVDFQANGQDKGPVNSPSDYRKAA